jgi:hypothetical protein
LKLYGRKAGTRCQLSAKGTLLIVAQDLVGTSRIQIGEALERRLIVIRVLARISRQIQNFLLGRQAPSGQF